MRFFEFISSKSDRIFKIFAVLFWVLGFVTFLNAAVAWQVSNLIPWASFSYAVLNALVGYGFWKKSAWLLWAFLLQTVTIVIISILRFLDVLPRYSDAKTFGALFASMLIFFFLLALRENLTGSRFQNTLFFIGFFLLWIIPFFVGRMIVITSQ